MTLFECLKSFLSGNQSLAAKVVGGFYPGFLPQSPTLPVATMRYISGASEPPTHDSGVSPWSMMRVEITFWGPDYKTLEQCASIASGMFTSSSPITMGSNGAGVFCPRQIQGPRDVRDQETRLTGIQVDVIGLFNGVTVS